MRYIDQSLIMLTMQDIADKNKPKNAQKKRRRKNKTKANKQTGNTPGSPKIGMTTDDVIFVGESSGEAKTNRQKNGNPNIVPVLRANKQKTHQPRARRSHMRRP